MASTQYTFPGGDGDALTVVGVPTLSTIQIRNSFNVSTNPDGTPTATNAVSGGVTLNALGLIDVPFTNYMVSFDQPSNTYTVTADQLGGLAKLRMSYVGQNPQTVNVNVTGLNLDLPLLGPTNITVTPNPAAVVNVTPNVPCFAAGTLIRTSRGEVAVEDLRVGDVVETTSGKSRSIIWLGNTEIDVKMMAHPIAYQPIRIVADAFGPGMPYSDLVLSPGHGLCVKMLDEVIVPPVALVNGTTITQLDEDHVSYWHVELDAHDILYANGMPAESYINVGNRGFFGAGVDPVDPARTLADYCRPYVSEGALVSAMREQLRLRAEKLGWHCETSPFAGLYLEADGARIEPETSGMTARFAFSADAAEVWLVSDASVPAQVMDSHDTRRLGVLLSSLRLVGGTVDNEIALDNPLLCVGFHAAEAASDAGLQRWTTGRARLPASFWKDSEGCLTLEIQLAAPPLPKWVAPILPAREPAKGRLRLVAVA